jgi:uncharacterized protein
VSADAEGPENRLAGESSPYLLLHRHNPVDWYPWGEEALARAKAEDRPIFLSVGYSTCYWCHVMERESFSNRETAALMNRELVNIKLDREERPDLDEIYMAATQILAGQGGWPNSVFLTPDLKPFYAGTYFPPEERYGRPGFPTLVTGLAEAWRDRRGEVEQQAEEMAVAMRRFLEERATPAAEAPGVGVAERSVAALFRRYDREHGGFGGAPKFPTPSNLFLLLEMAAERPEAGEMLAATLDQMARGGLYDQLAGGFHRYSTDREWKVPHFEKMLYDNALLLELYAREHARTGDPQAARIARETAAFLDREMTSRDGALWSAIDAETHGHEGAYYVWTRTEIEEALGEEDAAFLSRILGFAGEPFFEGNRYVLHLSEPLADMARRRRLPEEELVRDVKALEERLLAARWKRERPATDDKVLADWNGMAIAGLAVAGELLFEPKLVARAEKAASFLLGVMRPAGGPLLHAWRDGKGKIPAYLSDYAFVVRGLLALHRAVGLGSGDRWLAAAIELTHEQIDRLRDPQGGFFVAAASPDVLFRSKEVFDGAVPASNSVAILNLLELAELTGDMTWREEAEAGLKAFAPLVEAHPDAVRMLAIAARRFHGGGVLESQAAHEREATAGTSHLDREAAQRVSTHLELDAAGDDGFHPFRLQLTIAEGWHIQANPASEPFLLPTTLEGSGAELADVVYPAGDELTLPYSKQPLAVYRGTVTLAGKLRKDAPSARLVLTFQPCDDARCLPPVTREVAIG